MTSGAGRDRRAASASAASRAARIMSRPPDGVHVDHPDAEPRRGGHRAGHGIRDVVELQIEKHAVAARHKVVDERRAVAGEEPAADLEPAGDAAKTIGQRERICSGVDVECDEELVHFSGQWSVLTLRSPSRRCPPSRRDRQSRAIWWRSM